MKCEVGERNMSSYDLAERGLGRNKVRGQGKSTRSELLGDASGPNNNFGCVGTNKRTSKFCVEFANCRCGRDWSSLDNS